MKRKYSMLIADDEPAARAYAMSQIEWERLEITSLYEADNGRTALELILEKHPDIMILDIRMPQMDGIELLEEICRRKIEISVIGLSGYSDFEAARKMLSSGRVVEYLLKPASADALFEAVTKCQERMEKLKRLQDGGHFDSQPGNAAFTDTAMRETEERAEETSEDPFETTESGNLEEPTDSGEFPSRTNSRRSAIVSMAKQYIEANYSGKLSLEEIAAQVYVNPSYLSRLFAEEGLGVQKYIQQIRIERAKELLQDPRYKVYEVGDMVGYPNFHHFLKIFRKYENLTPSQYREQASWLFASQDVKK